MRKTPYLRRGSALNPAGASPLRPPQPKPPKKENQKRKGSAAASLPLVGTGRGREAEMRKDLPEMGLKG